MRRARDPLRSLGKLLGNLPLGESHDPEASYRKPVSTSDKIRLTLKGALVVAAFFWYRAASSDGRSEGAELAIAVGGVCVVAGAADLVAALRGDIEMIFIETRTIQIASRAALMVGGIALLVLGVLRRA